MAVQRAFEKAKSGNVFGQRRKRTKMLRAGLYARVSTNEQQTLAMQTRICCSAGLDDCNASPRGDLRGDTAGSVRELIDAARRREIDVVLAWRLDRWGRSRICWRRSRNSNISGRFRFVD